MGMKKVKTFLNDQLRNRTTAINASIKKNNYKTTWKHYWKTEAPRKQSTPLLH